jgi:hypothetical protein
MGYGKGVPSPSGEFGILENIVIGGRDMCGKLYYTADILHAVHDLTTGEPASARTEVVPARTTEVSATGYSFFA